MTDIIIAQDLQVLVDGWLEAERKGERFPVPFDMAWKIAGYARKDHGKRRLVKFKLGVDYFKEFSSDEGKTPQGGRSSDSIFMSCDALKHFCLLAETEQGDQIRQYFIEAEKKWKLVEQHYPQVAQDVERLSHERQQEKEILKLKMDVLAMEKALLDKREYIVTALPEPMQQKILGYQTVKEVEYRDRIIRNEEVLNDGSTVTKSYLCKRFGFLTKSGAPNYKALEPFLSKLPTEAFGKTLYVRDNLELKREFLGILDKLIDGDTRQMFLGE